MEFTYIKTSMNRWTFQSKKIKQWVESRCEGKVLNLFAGKTVLDVWEFRVDINPEMVADKYMDALEYVKQATQYGNIFNTVLLDPPYSYRKSMTKYDGKIASNLKVVCDLLPQILSPEGLVITFGYRSVVLGESRGFKQEEIALISRGGAYHDTIATIERKKA